MSQRGSLSLLMALGIIPALLFFAIGSLSVSRLYYRIEHQQKMNDAAAMLAGSAFPDTALATERVSKYLELRSNMTISKIDLSFSDGGISLKSSGSYKMELVDVFGINFEIPFSISSRAKMLSRNIALAVDTSHYLAPEPYGNEIWRASEYPSANFLESNFNLLELGKYALSSELLTQRCFNPLFDSLKKAALEITAFERSYPNDNFALAAFPGYRNFYDELYYQGSSTESLAAGAAGKFAGSPSCAAAAEREYSNLNYRFPAGNAVFGLDYYINSNDLTFNDDLYAKITPEEQIWSLGVKEYSSSYNIDQLFRYLISALSGGVNEYSLNKAIILAGDLPYYNGERYPESDVKKSLGESIKLLEQLAIISKSKIKLYYILFWNTDRKNFKDYEVEQFQQDIADIVSSSDALDVQLKIINSDSNYGREIYEVILENENALLVS